MAAGFGLFYALRTEIAKISFTGAPFFPGDLSLNPADVLANRHRRAGRGDAGGTLRAASRADLAARRKSPGHAESAAGLPADSPCAGRRRTLVRRTARASPRRPPAYRRRAGGGVSAGLPGGHGRARHRRTMVDDGRLQGHSPVDPPARHADRWAAAGRQSAGRLPRDQWTRARALRHERRRRGHHDIRREPRCAGGWFGRFQHVGQGLQQRPYGVGTDRDDNEAVDSNQRHDGSERGPGRRRRRRRTHRSRRAAAGPVLPDESGVMCSVGRHFRARPLHARG